MKKPFVIGISGSIGSGKSLIRHLLALRGVLTIDADELTHFLLVEGKAGYEAVLQIFGDWILTEDGRIDRVRLGKVVFNDPLALKKLERAMHPLVADALQAILENTTCPLVAVEAIKLYDSELLHVVNSRWFVTSTANARMERLEKTRGMTQHEITERLNQQIFPSDMKIDQYIENSERITDTWQQLDHIWREMSQELPEFKIAQEELSAKTSGFILDLPELEQIDSRTVQQIDQALQKEKSEAHEEGIILSRALLTPLAGGEACLIWRFDHFNTIVEGISHNCTEKTILDGLVKLETITKFWSGNCLDVHFMKNSGLLGKNLYSHGYFHLSSFDEYDLPFLMRDSLNEGTIETHWVKPMTDGIWRLIP